MERYEFLLTCKIKVTSRWIRDKYERQALKHLEDNIGEYFYKLKIRKDCFRNQYKRLTNVGSSKVKNFCSKILKTIVIKKYH